MTERRLYAVRGATTLDEDTRDQVLERTRSLLEALITKNDIEHAEIVSILLTATDDVHAEFPAVAARELGLTGVPLLCAREIDAHSPLALPRCIRVLMHYYGTSRPEPVYQEDAARILDLIARG